MMRDHLLKAFLPLEDAQQAAISMRLFGSDYSIDWRHNFIVAMTTLRAVGHVLHKVDTKTYPEIGPEVEARFWRWGAGEGDDAIFPLFIEDARNKLLKVYEFPISKDLVFENDELSIAAPDCDFEMIVEGPFAGRQASELILFACEWWQNELTEVEAYILSAGLHDEIRVDT